MQYLKQFHSALLLFALSFPPTAQAANRSTQGGALQHEREATYARAPKKLDSDPTVSSVLLVDIDLKGVLSLNALEGAALVAVGDGGGLSRAATMKGDVVMFHDLGPGTYSLRFVRMGNGNATVIVENAAPPEIVVTLAQGGIYYLGTVLVTKKFGFKPPGMQVIYDAKRELDAWLAFKKKYADSPWTALADRRVLALRSPNPAQNDPNAPAALAVRDSEKGDVVHVARGDPLSKLAGDWGLTVFVMGAGQFGGPKCGTSDRPGPPQFTLAPPTDGAVSFAAACDDGSEYSFRLKHDSATLAYVLTVKSGPGISVQDFPVAYVEGKGWQGERDQLVDGESQSVTAMVGPIEGRNWYGWKIEVLPTAAVDAPSLDDIKKPYFRADLTRRK